MTSPRIEWIVSLLRARAGDDERIAAITGETVAFVRAIRRVIEQTGWRR